MSSNSTFVEAEQIVPSLRGIQASSWIDMSSFALLIYDYILTFEDERTLLWPSHTTPTKILFFLTRYLPFIDVSITTSRHFMKNMSPHLCALRWKSAGWLINIGITTAELILLQRTRAIWGNTKNVTLLLLSWAAMASIPNFVIMIFFMDSIEFTPLPPGFTDCLVTSGNRLLMIVWIILMIYEAGILAALVIKWVQYFKEENGTSKLVESIVRKGSIFYIYIFILSVANVVVISRLQRDLENMLASITRVTHALLTSRLILTLRATAKQTDGNLDTTDVMMDSIGFDTNIQIRPVTNLSDSTDPGTLTILSEP